MDFKTLQIQKIDSITRIILNRPDKKNAQNRIMLDELDLAFNKEVEDPSTKVLILSGAGSDFSSGHDISPEEWKTSLQISWEDRYKECKHYYLDKMIHWRNLPKPLIAQVHGNCIMGGMMLAMICDFIICSEDAKFISRSVRWGGSSEQYLALPWFTNVAFAKQYIFTGDVIDAITAQRVGLVNEVVPTKDLDTRTLEIAKKISLLDSFALRCSKESLNAMQDNQGINEHLKKAFDYWAISALRPEIIAEWDSQVNLSALEKAKKRDEGF